MRGLVQLLGRQDWRESDDAERIAAVLDAAVADPSPVVRMIAAQALPVLGPGQDGPERVRRAGALLISEQDANVTAVLLNVLNSYAQTLPTDADAALRHYASARPDVLAAPSGTEVQEALTDLLTYLAVVHRTTYASETVGDWCTLPLESPHALQTVKHLRNYFQDGRPKVAEAAFSLAAKAAQAARQRWATLQLACSSGTPNANDERALRAGVQFAYELIWCIFSASGADADEARLAGKGCDPHDQKLEEFASRAVPVLLDCAVFGHAGLVDEVARTLIWLAPLNERRALTALAGAIRPEAPDLGAIHAGDDVMAYLRRLLADDRHLVLQDREGLDAFRSLLATFAAAGHEPALSLAYDFADVFR
ncbi:hypothetical protein [Kineococcus arenarius]|uniref:hypothetical protein n=1 Tax=unclassified Kineococcus TaxID=2621656 RepID=UPI003D7DE0EB